MYFGIIGLLLALALLAAGWGTGVIPRPQNMGKNKLDISRPEGMVNTLVLGFDQGQERSDIMMVASYNPQGKSLNLLSIPRDTMVVEAGKRRRINEIVLRSGMAQAIRRVEDITGLPIDYYISLDFAGFRKVVDLLGGVMIDVPADMDYEDREQGLYIHLRKGSQLLDGKKAEEYIRYRKYQWGDLDRIRVEQEFVRELIRQKFNVIYISKAPQLYMILENHVDTNIPLQDMGKYLSALVSQEPRVNTYTLPGDAADIEGVSYYIYNKGETRALIKESFIGGS